MIITPQKKIVNKVGYRIWKEVSLYVYIVGIFVLIPNMASTAFSSISHGLFTITLFLSVAVYRTLDKQRRMAYQMLFEDRDRCLKISFWENAVKNKSISISYDDLSFRLLHRKQFSPPYNTARFYNRNKFVLEVSIGYYGWGQNSFDSLVEKLTEVKKND